MKAGEWIASLEEWRELPTSLFDTDYLIIKICQETGWDQDMSLDVDDIRKFADECDLFYYASYGKEYPKKIDGKWVIVSEDEEYSDEMRQDFEEWINQAKER